MKLSKLYSNKPQLFEPIIFSPGLNVLSPEIRLTETKEKDNHNHGKTTLGQLIDFNLLSDKNNKFLSFKHGDRFQDVILILEIELHDNNYLTISRSISEPNKIGFNSHQIAKQDYTTLPESQWDHVDIPFDRAKRLLDDLLDLTGLAPWNYGKG
ncbi:MAG: DUF2326 domain-containing protein, partial [Deltaproteobacteria bacterium]|nr:DUF2326 domain-containing protein [Deltaproteobacteria bacterium]